MTLLPLSAHGCDAPACPTVALSPDRHALPAGWSRLSSTAWLDEPGWQKPFELTRTGRRRAESQIPGKLDLMGGHFSLAFCHLHPLDGDPADNPLLSHRPKTVGARPRGRGRNRDPYASVSCSCGWSGGIQAAAYMVRSRPEEQSVPSYTIERAWWRHLPEALRGYSAPRKWHP